ncbi:hypothetical protein Tco_0420693, partial [Tanacetum coccineum]
MEAGKRRGVPMVKVDGMKKGGIMAIVEGEAHGGLGLRGGLLGMQAQSHIGKIIISKLTYKLGRLLLLSPIDFRIEPQLGLYVKLGEMLGLRSLTSGIKSSGLQVLWLTRIDQEEVRERQGCSRWVSTVKGFLEFFDCSGSRQGIEDLRE